MTAARGAAVPASACMLALAPVEAQQPAGDHAAQLRALGSRAMSAAFPGTRWSVVARARTADGAVTKLTSGRPSAS
jgi:hypothetical protein